MFLDGNPVTPALSNKWFLAARLYHLAIRVGMLIGVLERFGE